LNSVAISCAFETEFTDKCQTPAKQVIHDSSTRDADFLSGILITQPLYTYQQEHFPYLRRQRFHSLMNLH
jgi:hypothetical protein